ncbi:MFS-type transporter [Penicillium cinerascens]|uniref:MFS-type transporter n=1 Tax=Penicillium cinerascens TaxID=70096 RepID=A0A9W9T0C2_9EURO|nr:MFS-type transporter [Penicillium cinerascens]KAJ5204486.1 MFS-type transporter [Penicillium cinerascens]
MSFSDNVQGGSHDTFAADDDVGHTSEDIVLYPEPTDSPNDPLNWSTWRKYWHASLVLFIVGLTAATSNDASSAQYGMNIQLGVSWGAMNTASGILFLSIGYATLLLAPIPSLYGRRMVYIICLLWSIIGSVWMARTQNTQDALWNQLFVGASEACAEATAQLSLSDLFYQHRRGMSMGLYVLATSVGTFLGPLIAGFIADNAGWRWVGWAGAILSVATLILFYFGFEETTFDRKFALQGVTPPSPPHPATTPEALEKFATPTGNTSVVSTRDVENGSRDPRKSYLQQIALVTPSPTLRGTGFKQYLESLWHTLKVFGFPAVWYSGLQWGAQDGWLTFYLTIEEDNWVGPPWNYSDNAAAIMNVSTLIGAVIGCIYGGWFSDTFVQWMAKRNNNVFEPEHRLWLMFPAAVISPAGLMLFGIGSDKGWSWPGPYVGLGMIGFGWGCAGDLSMAYLQDAYPEMVLEGMVGVSVINNTIGCIFSFVAGDWLAVQSVSQVFIAMGVMSFVFMMTTAPMIYWGSISRAWTKPRYEKFVHLRDGK